MEERRHIRTIRYFVSPSTCDPLKQKQNQMPCRRGAIQQLLYSPQGIMGRAKYPPMEPPFLYGTPIIPERCPFIEKNKC